jgi:NAD(P)H-dependent FMN reductase
MSTPSDQLPGHRSPTGPDDDEAHDVEEHRRSSAAPPAHVLLVSGSTRAGSTNTAVLRTAPQVAPPGMTTVLYDGLAQLPAFNPDDDRDPLPPAVAEVRGLIGSADAVLFCTPEYAGGLPGSFKNLLDWTVGGGEMVGKPVAWLNVSSVAAPTGGADAHRSLATVLGYVAADVVGPACARAPMSRSVVGDDGTVADPEVRRQLAASLLALQEHVAHRGATAAPDR